MKKKDKFFVCSMIHHFIDPECADAFPLDAEFYRRRYKKQMKNLDILCPWLVVTEDDKILAHDKPDAETMAWYYYESREDYKRHYEKLWSAAHDFAKEADIL